MHRMDLPDYTDSISQERAVQIMQSMIRKMDLNLKNLTVLTECASAAYAYTPLMAMMAGAKVYAVGKDTSYGTFKNNSLVAQKIMADFKLSGEINFVEWNDFDRWNEADIITNSGMLRPITAVNFSQMKKTAVVPLMWETWEFRKNDLDILSAQQNHIPVIGTDEHYPKANMYGYPGMIAMHLLFAMGIEGWNNELILIGGGLTGKMIADTFQKLGFSFDWYTLAGNERADRCFPYSELRRILATENPDAIICTEHSYHELLIGKRAAVSFAEIKKQFPAICYGHIAGHIDAAELQESGLRYEPSRIMPPGYMTYETTRIGMRPVLELNAAGLKVGEIAAKARLAGKTIEEAIAMTVKEGIGMDFEGGFYNFRP
jgi:hypothetical protein